jgi:selenocysteine-specific elongation factor
MIVGTAGHIDHGKTALVRALTGVETDRLKEEKARGITIDLGFAYWERPGAGVIGFVDVPGHERFVHTMLAGAHGIDLVMLVVAADDGIMPQTREHLQILDLLGLTHGIVALTKCDLVDEDTLLARQVEIEEALAPTGLAGSAIFPVSSITGDGLPALAERLDAEARACARRDDRRLFRLAVDRSFALAGAGTIVTGAVLDGNVSVGDTVIVSPTGLEARVRSIHAQDRRAETARAGDRAALNLAGPRIAKDAIERGDMVVAAARHAPTARIDAELTVLATEPRALPQWMPVRLHHAATEVGARLVLLSDTPPLPGETADVQLVLDRPIAAASGDRFILRDVSQTRTIGGGRFLDLRAPERRRRAPERAAIRDAWREGDPLAGLAALLREPPHVMPLAAYLADRGLPSLDFTGTGIVGFVVDGREHVADGSRLEALEAHVVRLLLAWHEAHPDLTGMGLERLRQQAAPRLLAPVFRVVLRRLQQRGLVALEGAWVRHAGHRIVLPPEDLALQQVLMPLIGGTERFRPPRVRDIARERGLDEGRLREVFKRMQRAGMVDEVAHDHFFLRPTVAEMAGIVRDLSASRDKGWFVAAEFRDRLDNGRKVAIQILEFFDRHGVTLRRGDARRPNPHRRDLFETGPARGAEDAAAEGGESSPVGRPDFKSGWGREPVLGGFDSHSPPPVPPGEPAGEPADDERGGGR